MASKISTATLMGPASPKYRRLRATVAIAISAAFLLVAALAAAGLWWRHDEAPRAGAQRAGILAAVLAEHLTLRFKTFEEALYEVAANNRLLGGPDASAEDWFPVLRAAFSGLAGVTSLSVTDARGIVTYSTQPMTMRQPVAKEELYRQLSANPMSDTLVLDALYRDPTEGMVLMPVGRVLRTVNGEFEGMLVVLFAPGRLADLFAAVDLGPSGLVRIFHPNGQRLVPPPSISDPLDSPAPEFPLGPSADGVEPGLIIAPIEPGGEPFVTAYRRLDGPGLTVAVSFPEGALMASWWQEAKAIAAAVAIIGLALLLAAIAICRAARKALVDEAAATQEN
jgi:hypothetical protein